MTHNNRPTTALNAARREVAGILIVAVTTGLGVNLLSSGFGIGLDLSARWLVAFGLALIGLSICVTTLILRRNLVRDITYEGVFTIDSLSRRVIPFERYEFSEQMAEHVTAIGTENAAMRNLWTKTPFRTPSISPKSTRSESVKMVIESIEYFALRELSAELEEYFNKNSVVDTKQIVTKKTNDIPSVLLDNRFLSLFSRPMQERVAFTVGGEETRTEELDGVRVTRTVVAAWGERGEIYEAFELVLPKGSEVARLDDGAIQITTAHFEMTLTSRFDGFNSVLPQDFEQLYLGLDHRSVSTYKINIEVRIQFKPWAVLSQDGWEYYRWVDSYLERIKRSFEFESFIKQIDWDRTLTIAKVLTSRELDRTTRRFEAD